MSKHKLFLEKLEQTLLEPRPLETEQLELLLHSIREQLDPKLLTRYIALSNKIYQIVVQIMIERVYIAWLPNYMWSRYELWKKNPTESLTILLECVAMIALLPKKQILSTSSLSHLSNVKSEVACDEIRLCLKTAYECRESVRPAIFQWILSWVKNSTSKKETSDLWDAFLFHAKRCSNKQMYYQIVCLYEIYLERH